MPRQSARKSSGRAEVFTTTKNPDVVVIAVHEREVKQKQEGYKWVQIEDGSWRLRHPDKITKSSEDETPAPFAFN